MSEEIVKNLKGWNEFGIAPATNHRAAGYDFFVPNIKTPKQKSLALEAFKKSYKTTEDMENCILDKICYYCAAKGYNIDIIDEHDVNLLHLYLMLYSYDLEKHQDLDMKVGEFVYNYLTYDDKKNVFGIVPRLNDHVLICSGVHVALEHDTAGIFYNKSGMGTKGWDVRACVVDEDYAGICHLSASYTKNHASQGTFYCGDKFSQMVIEKISRGDEFVDLGEEEYKKAMSDSERGDNAMGSGDVKH